tara:strand:- start:1775 stop:5056 length:3282 start_codon:yes stop_codon:yes gene_type:complete
MLPTPPSNPPSFETQLSFINYEMGRSDGLNVAREFQNNPNMTVSQAATVFENKYERANGSALSRRIDNANSVFRASQFGTLDSISPNASSAFNYFTSQGYTPEQASGIVGNLMAESGSRLDPTAFNTAGGGNGAFGIAQWRGPRLANVLRWDGTAIIPSEDYVPDPTNNVETINSPEAAAEAANGVDTSAYSNQPSYYQENVLNKYEGYTYNWAIHMINPTRAQEFEQNLTDGTYITLAESGVENEISIETIIQQTTLGFVRENRNAVSNSFDISFTEPKGMTFLNRIMLAANELGIRNHLEANYLLELTFRGWTENNTAMGKEEIGPFYYVANITDFQMKHVDSATNYQVTFIETEYAAYRRMDFHLKTDITVDASNFGEFLDNFTTELNTEVKRQAETSIARIYPNEYVFGAEGEAKNWRSWEFDSLVGSNLQESRNVSVSSSGGKLKFVLHAGTSMTAAIAAAILQTRNFKRIPLTGNNQFAKDNTDDSIGDHRKLAELMKWFMFKTSVKYLVDYDPVAKQYPREFTYNIVEYTIPQGIHDPFSFQALANDDEAQQARLDNILRNGMLRKRYDYTYTGLNSEVLDVDLSLNTIFFVVQPIAGGQLGTAAAFPGMTQQETRSFQVAARYQDAQSEVTRIEREMTSITEELSQPGIFDGRRGDLRTRQSALQSELDPAARHLERVSLQVVAESRRLDALRGTGIVNFNPIANKYITQTDLYSGSERTQAEKMNNSMQFDYRNVNDSLASSSVDANDDPGAAMLGALEINLNSSGELVEQRLSIRGDPYWLGKPKGAAASNNNQADYDVGGLGYFFNMRLPVYENETTGLMPEQNFGVTALYRVSTVTSQYMMGEFKQTLESIRDTNTNNEMLIQQLIDGKPFSGETRTLQQSYVDPDPENDVLPNEVASQQQPDTSTTLDPNATGSGNGTITGSNNTTGSTTNINPKLLSSMEAAAAATGLTGVISPRGGNRGPGQSGRHNGYAADISLYDGNRLLSVENPADLALIQNYTQNFLNETRSAGLTPSVGIANPTQGTGRELYMSGVVHHFDIARTPGIGASLSSNAGPYWGGSGDTIDHPTPSWLVNMYNAAY